MTDIYVWVWSDERQERKHEIFMAGRDSVEEAREELLDWLLSDRYYDEIIKSDLIDEEYKNQLTEQRESKQKKLLGPPTFQHGGDGDFQIRFCF